MPTYTSKIDTLLDRDNAPQAVLRDLNRPVEDFERRLEPAFPPPTADEDMTFAVRDALRWRPEPLPVLDKPLDLRVEWKRYHATPWADLVAQAKAAQDADRKVADEQAAADAAEGLVYRW